MLLKYRPSACFADSLKEHDVLGFKLDFFSFYLSRRKYAL